MADQTSSIGAGRTVDPTSFIQPVEEVDVVHPICCTQKIAIYETKSRFYLVGSNNSQTRFRVLKIDRTEPTELNLIDDKVEYSNNEIRDLLQRIDVGNRPKSSKTYEKSSIGLVHRGSAFGIVGFVKFLEGYYMILISKRRRVALVGGHTIYKIDDTVIIPIANEQARAKLASPDEARYLRIFQNVDLSSNFYFSYSYDLTRTLQYNMAPYYGLPVKYTNRPEDSHDNSKSTEHSKSQLRPESNEFDDVRDGDLENQFQSSFDSSMSFVQMKDNIELSSMLAESYPPRLRANNAKLKNSRSGPQPFRGQPAEKFVWNSHILAILKNLVHPDWILNIIHGFVGQSNICVFGKPLFITLIARRSNKYAGTRFLKRGSDDQGHVANDVETEQMCHDASVITLRSGSYTSYTQIRGSVPFFWSQDTVQGRITPRPQILVDRADPFFTTTAHHFGALMARFGSPIIILNLVKKKEKKPHEQILSDLLRESVDYLNQFLPADHAMQYIAWDMARVTKSKEINVIESLAEIASKVMKETGFFHSGPQIYCNELRQHPQFVGMKGFGYTPENPGLRQTGILRVNCVDCLDRTNTAQFMVGKCALGFQLYALGVTDSPVLEFDSDAVRMLEELFEAHGDTLALQYGGSQMVHRIRTYRKIAPWTSYSRDIMQTVSRYYSNAFTDTDKQQAINLFLGVFQPSEKFPPIWDILTDYYLHHSDTMNLDDRAVRPSYTKWYCDEVLESLPFPAEEVAKRQLIANHLQTASEGDEESMDLFAEFYRPSEFTEFDQLYSRIMPTSTKDFMPSSSADPSPFVVRARGRTQDPAVPPRKAIGGSPSSPDESSEESSSSDEEKLGVQSPLKVISRDSFVNPTQLQAVWPSMSDLYWINVSEPLVKDKELYSRYAELSKISTPVKRTKSRVKNYTVKWTALSEFSEDSTDSVKPPSVSSTSTKIYNEYYKVGFDGPSMPADLDVEIYRNYVAQNYL